MKLYILITVFKPLSEKAIYQIIIKDDHREEVELVDYWAARGLHQSIALTLYPPTTPNTAITATVTTCGLSR